MCDGAALLLECCCSFLRLDNSKEVTFIDTPGHAAFKAMRSRGARTTDIVVLVVDSSEGVLEQTLESIRMIRGADTPMLVALNKIDRPGADVDATKLALKEAGVDLEEFGGDVQAVPISALKGTNVDRLIESLQGRPVPVLIFQRRQNDIVPYCTARFQVEIVTGRPFEGAQRGASAQGGQQGQGGGRGDRVDDGEGAGKDGDRVGAAGHAEGGLAPRVREEFLQGAHHARRHRRARQRGDAVNCCQGVWMETCPYRR